MHAHARVCAAVAVAGGLFEVARLNQATQKSAKTWKLAQMAADAIDRTQPKPELLPVHRNKPAEVSDTQFLSEHTWFLEPLEPSGWPPHKVRPREWGEFTRVMHGLDEFLGANPVSPKEVTRNRQALLSFVAHHAHLLSSADRGPLLSELTNEGPNV